MDRVKTARVWPFIQGTLFYGGQELRIPLTFMLDTGLDNTFICPKDERKLIAAHPDLADSFLQDDVRPLSTINGRSPMKILQGGNGGAGVIFTDDNGVTKSIDLEFLYFAASTEHEIGWMKKRLGCCEFVHRRAGQGLSHSIIGRDVLEQFALVSVAGYKRGFLDDRRAKTLKDAGIRVL